MSDENSPVFESEVSGGKSNAQRRLEQFLGERFPELAQDGYTTGDLSGEERDEEALIQEAQEILDGVAEAGDTAVAATVRRLLVEKMRWRMKVERAEQISPVREVGDEDGE
jgi:hypothetical protein